MTEVRKKRHKSRGLYEITPGYATFRWLTGITLKQASWLLGSLEGRGGFEAWATHLVDGFQEARFLSEFEKVTDPWQRSRIMGEKISLLARQFSELTRDQKAELARRAEIELKAGQEMLSREKRRVLELLKTVRTPLDE